MEGHPEPPTSPAGRSPGGSLADLLIIWVVVLMLAAVPVAGALGAGIVRPSRASSAS